MLILAPSMIFRPRRKKIAGFSRKFCALAVAKGHLTPAAVQDGLLARTAVSRVVTAVVETPPSCVPPTLSLMEMGHKVERVLEDHRFTYGRRTRPLSIP